MSLCLALLLAVVAIDWWHGWKPFTHPFQMPGNQWKRVSTIYSQRRRSTLCPGSIVDARESRRAPCSAALSTAANRAPVPRPRRCLLPSISSMKAMYSEGIVDAPNGRLTAGVRAIWISHSFRHYQHLPDRCRWFDVRRRDLA